MVFSEFSEVTAKVVPGYGVASGKSEDGRFPDGTLNLQIPFFNKLGLNLSHFYRGTLNLDLSPVHKIGVVILEKYYLCF